MDEALAGLLGIVGGAILGGSGKYWSLRRDAWRDARASGLMLLADVRAVRRAEAAGRVSAASELRQRWELEGKVLAAFRRGSFPNGFRAPDWLQLAAHLARFEELHDGGGLSGKPWQEVEPELEAAENLLAQFEDDPAVVRYVVTDNRKTVRLGGFALTLVAVVCVLIF